MKTADFYYDLPKELIAQTPVEPRDSSRLLVLDRKTGEIEHRHFYDIIDYLREGDLIVANDSRVLPARIYGVKEGTGARVEFLLLRQISGNRWETLCKPGKKAREGAKFSFGGGILKAAVTEVRDDGNRVVDFDCDESFFATAPTAGLHFTEELMERIRQKGVRIAYVTLHVGLGTFRPVKVDDVTKHKMHSEHYEVPGETAELIRQTKANGGRIIAIGTTSCRTLESVAAQYGEIRACEGFTDIFIYPGYEFKVLDGLVTNFHLPESTLIMLVSAFAGYDNIMNAYKTAVEERYRFFSFGDAMMIS